MGASSEFHFIQISERPMQPGSCAGSLEDDYGPWPQYVEWEINGQVRLSTHRSCQQVGPITQRYLSMQAPQEPVH